MDFKQLRETQGLTMKEISQLLGVSENYLWMIESGKRKMSKLLSEKFDNIVADITTNNINVVKSQSIPQQTDPSLCTRECHCEDESEEVCSICGQRHPAGELDVYKPRNVANTVLDNNHKLTEISAGITAISNGIGAIAKLDTIIQRRVDNVMSTRSRALIAVYNHHIVAQARVMVSSLETLIDLIKNGAITLDGAIIMLEDLKRHLGDLRGYDPTDPLHNPAGDSPWDKEVLK